MTETAIRKISRALTRDLMRGTRTPAVDRQLRHVFQQSFDRAAGRPNHRGQASNRRFTVWLAPAEYLELRRQILMSGASSLTAFLIKRLGLRAGGSPTATHGRSRAITVGGYPPRVRVAYGRA